jgi:hypothetical protein
MGFWSVVMKTVLRSCIGTDANVSNPNLLYHFINYYRSLGVERWAITLHVGLNREAHNLHAFQNILSEQGISFDTWHGAFNTYERESRDNAFVHAQGEDTWIVAVDLDEFVLFPAMISEYLEDVASRGFNCVGGRLVDRVSSNGELKRIDLHPRIGEQFPLAAEVRRYIYRPLAPNAPFEKKIAIRTPLQWGLGRHFITRETRRFVREDPEILSIDHYAWDDLLIERIQQRLDDKWAQEYRNMIAYIQEHKCFRLHDIVSLTPTK